MSAKRLSKIHGFFDYNAGAPLHPRVREGLLSFLEGSADELHLIPNASAVHALGRDGKKRIAEARSAVASSIGARPDDLLFCSSGTEANQMVVRSFVEKHGPEAVWYFLETDHSCHLEMAGWVTAQGAEAVKVPVGRDGRVTDDALVSHILKGQLSGEHLGRPKLFSFAWANNETGVIQNLSEWGPRLRAAGVRLHADGAQAWGKLAIDLESLGVDSAAFAGAKIGAFPGTGVLWAKDLAEHQPIFFGSQEKTKRGGTENMLGIMSLGWAAEAVSPAQFQSATRPHRDRLEERVVKLGAKINGTGGERLSNTLNFVLSTLTSDVAIARLDLEGFQVSSGSACASGSLEPSHVLLAMGLSEDEAKRALRISIPPTAVAEAVDRLADVIESLVLK
jgi:cysteine desulfurase